MTYVLNTRERKLLQYLQIDHEVFQIREQLPVGTGPGTLARLTELGLLQNGPGRFGDTGWQLSDDGWRCMYGKPYSELGEDGAPHHPLKVWSWPPTLDGSNAAPRRASRLTTLKPRLAELSPRLPRRS